MTGLRAAYRPLALERNRRLRTGFGVPLEISRKIMDSVGGDLGKLRAPSRCNIWPFSLLRCDMPNGKR
ncbi:hypothetical protein LGM90_07495 [Burkholderia sp. AU28942]|uniref:hypothetical protein n=1 Tax=Burkholderia TaxID=32008 RepID=UPI0012EAD46D|nr:MULTISPECIES: hypothetical protein [Burkholderia]MCA8308350.1 hypothetical protein [Burkholderia sp. AU28942]QTO51886.1 hypothetical protein J8I86_27395 [Burkholderia latens]